MLQDLLNKFYTTDLYKYISALLISPLWYAFIQHFKEFGASVAVTTVIIFWFCDFIFGTCCAVKSKEFDKSKLPRSLKKLWWYLIFLGIAWMFRFNSIPLAACPIEATIILIEGISVMTNAGNLSGMIILQRLSHTIEKQLDDRLAVLEDKATIVVTPPGTVTTTITTVTGENIHDA